MLLNYMFFFSQVSSNFDGATDYKANYLDLSGSGIETLNNYFFNTSITTYINVANSRISRIGYAAFNGVPNLVYLNISGNSPEFFDFYQDLPNLETLVLDGTVTPISTPANEEYPCDNYQLKEHPPLYESSNATMQFIFRYPKLKKLYLRGKNIAGVNIDELRFPNLTHLYLNQNNLGSSKLFYELPKSLTHLCLNDNNFTKVVRRIIGRKNKDGERVKTTQVIRYNFKNLKNLLHLDISHNKISHISKHTLQNLTALISIRLDHNEFSRIPELYGLTNLERLSLTYNKIHQINQTIFDFPSLKKLNLSNNKIDEISENAFNNLPLLEELDLSGNLLKSLPENWISKINVKYLYLNNNFFEYFANLSLAGTKKFKYMNISDNPITLESEDLEPLNSLSENIAMDFSSFK